MEPTPAGATNHGYSDSVSSSPRSRNTDSWDDTLPSLLSGAAAGASAKLRLMCSYGGHIVPRPHDKSLCYLGGDTRIVVVDRSASLADFCGRLSKTLLDGLPFTLKYQLPNEDLDSLVSVTTGEDLENMIEEYDRMSTSLKPSRLRLFLFPTKPGSASSIGSLLDDSKSETWFVNALNGAEILPRGLSADSSSVNCLLGLDDAVPASGTEADPNPGNRAVKQDVHSVPDSPMLETSSSSFGSTSSASAPGLSNLPPIRVQLGLEEQFSQVMRAEDGFKDGGFPPNLAAVGPPGAVGEGLNRVLAKREISDTGVVPDPPFEAGVADLAIPDSVVRDNLDTPLSRPKPLIYQDPVRHVPAPPIPLVSDPKREVTDPNYRYQVQVQDQNLIQPMRQEQQPQQQQQQQPPQPQPQQQPQFIHTGPHYIHHHATGPVPMSSYYQMPHPMQQHSQHPIQHSQQQPQVDQHYPMYFMPVRQNLHSSPATKPAPLANPGIVPSPYKDAPAMYPPRSAPPQKHELHRTVAAAAAPQSQPQLIHMPDSQHQYVGYHQSSANFAYEYIDPFQAQIYYTQPTNNNLASQYQTMTSAAAMAEASSMATDSMQNRTIQPP